MKNLTNDECIKKFVKIHGNKYDYSKVNYINARTKVNIICKIHGIFSQMPGNHMYGYGCDKCGILKRQINQTKTNEKFIKECKKIHGNEFNYSKVNYKNNYTHIEIKCPFHGTFFQTPSNHLSGQKCPECKFQVSKLETEFLDYLKINKRGISLSEWKVKKTDGYDDKTNTVYEFLGDYYHGNPSVYKFNKYNPTCHKTFGELYENTLKMLNKLKSLGYNVKYIWENEWKKFKRKETNIPTILSF